ncbi:hypothetical protein CKM354_000731000 [Cercospora kikuchii]|uniref:Uncharacterized protein n=1 Tax=Cercospora kikuchii TaxID=84275 RepID=A0A9P3FE64_9PEZI|nr:uncharacterized protein CKM354_000731000 [Cercospora kikuchii]GIZ44101.1 hypothetical protein CKM354_000731000 [Cercospora kikuchii]
MVKAVTMIRPSRPSRPATLTAATLFVLLILFSVTFREPLRTRAGELLPRPQNDGTQITPYSSRLHILLPASNPAVDMCKTLLTGSMLGYPTPTLIAWNETFNREGLLGGGSHVAKISRVLEWLDNLPPETDKDLIFMMDAYDIWFQLPPEVLVERYHMINRKANKRLRDRLGSAYYAENIRQTIIFGAGKRCAPNQMHTVACYPIPDSPLPDDLYGANTDTVMGKNKVTSHRQRYLNSGYIMGPAKDMRLMFRRAWEKVEANQDHDPWDNGSGGSDFMYHGSDQSIFDTVWGEQEFQREVIRRRHRGWVDRLLNRAQTTPHHIEGTLVQDPLNPPFTHQTMEHKAGKPDEFGIGLDYFSDLGQQTVNSEDDTQYLVHGYNLTGQIEARPKGLFNCPSRVTGELPEDVLKTSPPSTVKESWSQLPLFTNHCLNTIPVMIHHNGDKGARSWQWPKTWMQPHARRQFEAILGDESNVLAAGRSAGGATLPTGEYLSFQELCTQDFEYELFRDVDPPETPPKGW